MISKIATLQFRILFLVYPVQNWGSQGSHWLVFTYTGENDHLPLEHWITSWHDFNIKMLIIANCMLDFYLDKPICLIFCLSIICEMSKHTESRIPTFASYCIFHLATSQTQFDIFKNEQSFLSLFYACCLFLS